MCKVCDGKLRHSNTIARAELATQCDSCIRNYTVVSLGHAIFFKKNICRANGISIRSNGILIRANEILIRTNDILIRANGI